MKKALLFFIIICCGFIVYFILQNNFKSDSKILKFASWGSQSETAVILSVINDYEFKNPDIKIEFIHIPQNYFQKIHLLFASGLEPDVIFFNNQNIQMYIKAGLLENLTPYFPDAERIFYKEVLNCFKFDEKLYAIPRDISNLVIYYNKDIFKKENILMPEKIKDIYELKLIAEKLTTKEHFGINSEDDPLYWLYFLASNGGGVVSDDGKKIIIKDKKSIEALNLYSDFINKYHIAPSKSQIGSMTTAQMFINGKLALYFGGRWMVPAFRKSIDFDWDIIEFPASNENKVYINASGWAVSKKSKNKAAAVSLIKYLSSESTINEFAKSGLIIPARIDSSISLNFLDNKPPKNAKAFLDMINNAKPDFVNENYSRINDILKEKTQSVFYGEKTPDEAFDEKTVKKLESLI